MQLISAEVSNETRDSPGLLQLGLFSLLIC